MPFQLNKQWKEQIESANAASAAQLGAVTRQLQTEKDAALQDQQQVLTAKFDQEIAQLKRILQDEANQALELQSHAEQRIQELLATLAEEKAQHNSQVLARLSSLHAGVALLNLPMLSDRGHTSSAAT